MDPKSFKIMYDLSSNFCGVFIFATSWINPISELHEIEKELLYNKIIVNTVLFDLLRCNGKAFNRFFSAKFNGKNFENDSFQIEKVLPSNFKKIASEFYYLIEREKLNKLWLI